MNDMSDKDQQQSFVVPVNPLESIIKHEPNGPLSHYFNGAFVDLLQQGNLSQSMKSREPKDWQGSTKTHDDFEWTSEQIITLLEFYTLYPQLWDTKHEQYMNKDVRKQLISQLSEKIGAQEQAVNVKFQRLRVHFSRELRKEESSVHEAQPYQSKWKYYSNMLFLRDTLKCRQKIRQHNHDKDSLSLVMDLSHGSGLTLTSTPSSDSGHSSPDSTDIVSPSVSQPTDNKENMSPPIRSVPSYKSKTTVPPLSPSLITTPFSSLSSASLMPPLLATNPLFSSLPASIPAPPASLLTSFANLEHLLSPRMLAPLLRNKTEHMEGLHPGNYSSLLTPSTPGVLLAPTPQIPIPTSPLTPNVVCSTPGFWGNNPHLLSKEDEDSAALKSYQAKRQKIIKLHKEPAREVWDHSTPVAGDLSECDYFSLHVSESLRKMDVMCAEECKRAIQNTLYQYIVKSCQRQPFLSTPRYSNTANVRLVNRKS